MEPQTLKKGRDFVGVSIVCFCHDGKGNIAMLKRGANARDEHGRWDITAGGLEFGDTVEATIRKEILEELCTDVMDFEFLGFRDVHREYDGSPTHWVSLDFKVLINPDKVKIGEPHKFDDFGWFTLQTLPENLHSQLPLYLEKYKDKLK